MTDSADTGDRTEDLIAPIARRSLYEEVATRIRDLIIEGELAAGARLNEARLCEQLGVSRTPLREAIRTLASEGLIEVVPNRGALVSRLDRNDVYNMLQFLALIEPFAGRLACEVADDAGIGALDDLHQRMRGHFKRKERLAYYKLNQAFHSGVVAASGNATLHETHTMVQNRLKRIRFIGNERPGAWSEAMAEHEAMIDALRRRDGKRLAAVLEGHLWETWERVKDAL